MYNDVIAIRRFRYEVFCENLDSGWIAGGGHRLYRIQLDHWSDRYEYSGSVHSGAQLPNGQNAVCSPAELEGRESVKSKA